MCNPKLAKKKRDTYTMLALNLTIPGRLITRMNSKIKKIRIQAANSFILEKVWNVGFSHAVEERFFQNDFLEKWSQETVQKERKEVVD